MEMNPNNPNSFPFRVNKKWDICPSYFGELKTACM
jgi:hypothetical protein